MAARGRHKAGAEKFHKSESLWVTVAPPHGEVKRLERGFESHNLEVFAPSRNLKPHNKVSSLNLSRSSWL